MKKHNSGFSLVELMVSMVVGLIIILGAGQLFLNGFQSFRQVEMLGNKQAVLTFASDILMRDVRRSENLPFVSQGGDELTVIVDGESKRYYLDELDSDWSIYVQVDGGSPQPIVGGFSDASAFQVNEVSTGLVEVTFDLVGEPGNIVFHVMNRTEAVGGANQSNSNNGGGQGGGQGGGSSCPPGQAKKGNC